MAHAGPTVLIYDFGSQYTQLIARRIREIGFYTEIVAPAHAELGPDIGAVILSGGPSSVYGADAPSLPEAVLESGVPILGICYGLQLLAQALGGKVAPGDKKEYGVARLKLAGACALFEGVADGARLWMSHGDKVSALPRGFKNFAGTANCEHAAMGDPAKKIYGIQFHPEVAHTDHGGKILENFLVRVAGLEPDWKMENFLESSCRGIRAQVGERRVLLALSGGVDSSVLAALLERAIPGQTHMFFVDNGLLPAGERARVEGIFARAKRFRVIDAEDRFLAALSGKTDPEEKRKAVGRAFIEVFTLAAKALKSAPHFLAQGTLYPDRIESFGVKGPSAKIKSHHNVGGLPERLGFELLEPLGSLFKDEVRRLGLELGLPQEVTGRHPLPGPALAIRCVGEVTRERVEIARRANAIVEEEIVKAGLYTKLWQAFAVLLPVKSVGVMGDGRTYHETCVVRAVTSLDGMTADWDYLPHAALNAISSRIVNEVRGVNRVLFDVTSKPPATIEWE